MERLFLDLRILFILLHICAASIGLVGATMNAVNHKSFIISIKAVQVSIVLLVLTGIALFIPKQDILIHSGVFQMKVFVMSIILLIYSPLLRFVPKKIQASSRIIQLSSWYFLFFLVIVQNISFEFIHLFSIYILLIFSSIGAYLLTKKAILPHEFSK